MLNETSIKMKKFAFCYEFFNLTYRGGGGGVSYFKILNETSIEMKKIAFYESSSVFQPKVFSATFNCIWKIQSHDLIRAVFQFKQQLLAE